MAGSTGIWLMLSERERQIVMCAREGLIDKEIALKLNIGMGTVRTYWERIRTKTGARSRAELVALIGREDMDTALSEVKTSHDVLTSIIDHSWFGLALYAEEDREILHTNKIFRELCKTLSPTLFPPGFSFANEGALNLACIQEFLQLEHSEPRATIGLKEARYRISSARFSIGDRPATLVQLDDVTKIEQARANQGPGRLSEVFSKFRVPLIVTTRTGSILYATEPAEKLLERNSRDLIARKLQDLLIPVEESDWHRLVMTHGSIELQFRYPMPNAQRELHVLTARMSNRLSDRSVRGITVLLSKAHACDSPPPPALNGNGHHGLL